MVASRRRAVTLIEIMVVMTILSIFLLVSVPSMRGLHERNLISTAAREFCAQARYARAQAILHNQTVELRIDTEKHRYRVEIPSVSEGGGVRVGGRRVADTREEYKYLDGKKMRVFFSQIEAAMAPVKDGQELVLKFHKDGSASAGTVLIADKKDRRMMIEIAGASGAIRAYKGLPQPIGPDLFREVRQSEGGY
jgi:prepilin-type N-terminal cleavage/methylation domain-containing protein